MRNTGETYKIRQVIDLTGVSEFLLRAWEDRYAAIKPARSKTGRRLYSQNDVLKVRALFSLTQMGHRVGDIAQLGLNELNQMLNQDLGNGNLENPNLSPFVKEIMTQAKQFAWQDVRKLILGNHKMWTQQKGKTRSLNWIHSLIVPLLSEIGRQTDAGHLSIAEEHILSAIIKESLSFQFDKRPPNKKRPRIVFATPEGDYHDMGIAIGAYVANSLGANTLFLGAHMPKTELAAVCVRYKTTHLVLSSTSDKIDGAKDQYLKYLNFLDRNLNTKISIWLAGRNSQKYEPSLKRPFRIIESFEVFETEVRKAVRLSETLRQ
ncbi:MAG: MerR family transcriptional regulator [Bdellovibrionales bacterium]|nr:MerR family transcriptional regulator [Bdellovibrionales bacterium]